MKFWYQKTLSWKALLLLPFSWIFSFIVLLRYYFYRFKLKKVFNFPKPIIIVGNITVGGTGKTPFVIYLANFLKKEGYKPGIVSRGCGGKIHKVPKAVKSSDNPAIVGDEALLLIRNTDCPLILCKNRSLAVDNLLKTTDCDVVLADDGLQHYALNRDIEIAMVDAKRQFGNGLLLPAGPLRESKTRLKRCAFIIEQGPFHPHKITMQLLGQKFIAVNDFKNEKNITDFLHQKIHAVAGLGHPERFFDVLKNMGLDIIPHVFPDHHLYTKEDFNFKENLNIVMTEKDAVKCETFATDQFWYLSVDVNVPSFFTKNLLRKLEEIKYAHP